MSQILIIEDDAILSKMYKTKFVLAGYDVVTAADGEEGLQSALREKPDIILLDIMLPKIDGLSMMDTLRKDNWGKNVPIIVLTNLDVNDAIIQKILVDQPSYYILKSNSIPEEIIEKVESIVRPQIY